MNSAILRTHALSLLDGLRGGRIPMPEVALLDGYRPESAAVLVIELALHMNRDEVAGLAIALRNLANQPQLAIHTRLRRMPKKGKQ